jgi:hypothetical protein
MSEQETNYSAYFFVERIDEGRGTTALLDSNSPSWNTLVTAADHRAAALLAFQNWKRLQCGRVVALGKAAPPEPPWRLRVRQFGGESKTFKVSKQVVTTYSAEEEITT